MQSPQETYPNGSEITLKKLKPIKRTISTNCSTIALTHSTIDLTLKGTGNRVVIEDTAGKLAFKGDENQIAIKKSWLVCQVQGSSNMMWVSRCEFQLKLNKGTRNYIQGVSNKKPMQALNQRLMLQRNSQMRAQAERQHSRSVKRLLPNLLKSQYSSQTRECPVCYDDIASGEQVTSLFCFHLFHSACIETCLQTMVKCPVCSLDLLKHVSAEITSGVYVYRGEQLLVRDSIEDK